MNIIEKIIANFINNKSLYIGEKVTISEHMIQSAMIAEKAKSSNTLVCACLLHDYGHFILEDPDELVRKKLDGKHEDLAFSAIIAVCIICSEIVTFSPIYKDLLFIKLEIILSIIFIKINVADHLQLQSYPLFFHDLILFQDKNQLLRNE